MTAIRCTAKLLKRLQIDDPGSPPPPGNRLGDWFANIIYTRRGHYIILVSETSLLPVLTTARRLENLVPRFLGSLSEILKTLQVPPAAIARELEAMQPIYFGRTNNRVVLGSMNDFVSMFRFALERNPDSTDFDWSIFLARTPCSPLGMKSPDRVAPRLLRNPHGFGVVDGGGA